VSLILDDDERVGRWLLDRIDYVEGWQPGHKCIGYEKDGQVMAAVGQPSMCVFRLATDPSEAETKEILLNEKTEEAILMSPASRKV
jgi:hypothetical protein